MKKRINLFLLLSGILSMAAAAGLFRFAYAAYNSIVATRPVVVAAVDIPPYTLIAPEHLTLKDLPRALESEPIFLSPEEVVGRIAVGPIPAGAVIYRSLAVPQSSFRFVSDPALEVVSIPVDPARAVGGQVRVGMRVNVYRVALARGAQEKNPLDLLARRGAEVQLLAASVPVVDVRSGGGEPVSSSPPPSRMEQSATTSSGRPLQIVTMAVPPAVAESLIRLAVEQKTGEYELWLTLAPVSP